MCTARRNVYTYVGKVRGAIISNYILQVVLHQFPNAQLADLTFTTSYVRTSTNQEINNICSNGVDMMVWM